MEKQQPSSSAVHVDTIMRDDDEERLRKFAPTVLIKGDYVGHPFRGNQWTDASGAPRAGARSSDDEDDALLEAAGQTLEEMGVETLNDEAAARIGGQLRDRTAAFRDAGGKISVPLENAKQAEAADNSIQRQRAKTPPATEEMMTGRQMAQMAIAEFEEDGYLTVRVAKSADGEVAGAVSYSEMPVDPLGAEPVESGGRIIMETMGSMNTVRGAGTAMFLTVLRHAARTNSGITLQPLDEQAAKFWLSVGFEDSLGESVMAMTAETVQKLVKAAS